MEKINLETDIFNKDSYIEGIYVDPIVIPKILIEKLHLAESYKDLKNKVESSSIALSIDDINSYFKRLNCKEKILLDNQEEIDALIRSDFKSCYDYKEISLKYFQTYVDILKRRTLKILYLIEKIICYKNVGVLKLEDMDMLNELDIKIDKKRNIYYHDMMRLLSALCENINDLFDMVIRSNDITSYLTDNLTITERKKIVEGNLFPSFELQIKDLNVDDRGFIALSINQVKQLSDEKFKVFQKTVNNLYN